MNIKKNMQETTCEPTIPPPEESPQFGILFIKTFPIAWAPVWVATVLLPQKPRPEGQKNTRWEQNPGSGPVDSLDVLRLSKGGAGNCKWSYNSKCSLATGANCTALYSLLLIHFFDS